MKRNSDATLILRWYLSISALPPCATGTFATHGCEPSPEVVRLPRRISTLPEVRGPVSAAWKFTQPACSARYGKKLFRNCWACVRKGCFHRWNSNQIPCCRQREIGSHGRRDGGHPLRTIRSGTQTGKEMCKANG